VQCQWEKRERLCEFENRSLTFFPTGTETDTDTGLTIGNRHLWQMSGFRPIFSS
jgi:hypothetical protein